MLITGILLIAMLGAIVLATGSVEEDKISAPVTRKAVKRGLLAVPPVPTSEPTQLPGP
jgi:hypothetical protein